MGIEPEKFVSTVDEDFICSICTIVLEDPIKIARCEHMFCRLCIDEWMKKDTTCPVDRTTINQQDLIAPDRTVVNMLNKLKIRCEFESLGCVDVFRLEIWKSHVNECDLNPANKWMCEGGCEKIVTRKEADSHSCVDTLKQENAKLKNLVEDFQLKNSKLEEENQILKQNNEEQSDLIKQMVDENDKSQKKFKELLKENKLPQSTSFSKNMPVVLTNQELEDKTFTSSINKWSILSQLPSDLKGRVQLASILETDDNHDAVIITKDEEAFWITIEGQNSVKPIKIDKLCGLKIKSLKFNIEFGSRFNVVALNEDGNLLTCSFVGNLSKEIFKPIVNLNEKIIVQMDIGSKHKLALTSDGEVFAWGNNFYGQLGTETKNLDEPMKLTGKIESLQTVAVACCPYSSFAVINNGDVFAWGHNQNGQLGLGNKKNKKIPTKIEALSGIKIRRLACGWGHVLAVANNGSMFAWGFNCYGQLGSGDTNERNKPIKVGPSDVKFIEVAACTFPNHLSVALSEDGRVWVWGRCRIRPDSLDTENVLLPKPVESTSIHDAIAEYANYQMTWNMMVIRQ